MREVSRNVVSKDINVEIYGIIGINRIVDFDPTFGITFNQFLAADERPMLIHTGPVGMYQKIEEKIKK